VVSKLVLDFDIENRPLSYLGMDFTTSDITAIAAGFLHQRKIHYWVLGEVDTHTMLEGFVELYNRADMVTGHYIRRHDLPIINGALMEFGMAPLGTKLTSDTKLDLVRRKDLSASQESLSAMLGLKAPKVHMTQNDWRLANRLERLDLTRNRVVGDIRQHKELRAALLKAGLLGRPKLWKS
jgi:hypothetical protein